MNKSNYNYREKIIEEQEESLHFCILKGCCPRCLSKEIEYREFLTNQRFGFKCHKCSWQDKFSVEELMQFARRWI